MVSGQGPGGWLFVDVILVTEPVTTGTLFELTYSQPNLHRAVSCWYDPVAGRNAALEIGQVPVFQTALVGSEYGKCTG